jgi:hypothetical protein
MDVDVLVEVPVVIQAELQTSLAACRASRRTKAWKAGSVARCFI